MSKTDILAELPKLLPHELAEIQVRLDELAGDTWLDKNELSAGDKLALDAGLAEYQKNPNAGSSWEEVKTRIMGKLHS